MGHGGSFSRWTGCRRSGREDRCRSGPRTRVLDASHRSGGSRSRGSQLRPERMDRRRRWLGAFWTTRPLSCAAWYWRLRAYDLGAFGSWSQVWDFSVDARQGMLNSPHRSRGRKWTPDIATGVGHRFRWRAPSTRRCRCPATVSPLSSTPFVIQDSVSSVTVSSG